MGPLMRFPRLSNPATQTSIGRFTDWSRLRRMNRVIPMIELIVRDMKAEDEYFVTTCSHVHESAEIDACAEMRRRQFKVMKSEGGVFKVALLNDEHIGFAYGIPIERSSWGPLGHSLMVIPCLHVSMTSHGCGKGTRRLHRGRCPSRRVSWRNHHRLSRFAGCGVVYACIVL